MGGKRQRTGVRAVSNTSIQIDFEYKGQRCRERLRITPTPANLKRVEQHRAAICDAIARDTFDYAVSFPDSPRRHLFAEHKGSGYPLEDYLESWLKAIKPHLKASTWDDYRKIVENTLTPAIGRSSSSDSSFMTPSHSTKKMMESRPLRRPVTLLIRSRRRSHPNKF